MTRSSRGLILDVASDMLCLNTRSQAYAMEIMLDPQVDEERTAAEFNRSTQVCNSDHRDLYTTFLVILSLAVSISHDFGLVTFPLNCGVREAEMAHQLKRPKR
ncbi:hypothetical protein PHET_03608 [Paragonimus heterotremus]|uniref:PIH1D1/2/3 CS-like domain-containing protein n=1 Tax=Paragonimus heterotremus TaxID=100268 RepID=A0A8J4SQN4_9TREM|nr:hypothetical protein PHET_03608 [Paragonimus heterotremus]